MIKLTLKILLHSIKIGRIYQYLLAFSFAILDLELHIEGRPHMKNHIVFIVVYIESYSIPSWSQGIF
jgi:hypothetical protein